MGSLERAGGHAGEQGDAEGGLGVDEADGVLGVFYGAVEKLQSAGEDKEFAKLRQNDPRIGRSLAQPRKRLLEGRGEDRLGR